MCAKLFYFLLAAFLTFNVITIVAFVYLPWWQALIVVLSVILAFTLAGKYLVRSAMRNALQMTTEVLQQHSRVLKNASVTVHSIRLADMPQEARDMLENDDDEPMSAEDLSRVENLIWREIELSIFPDLSQLQPGDDASWYPHTLCLVPESWTYEDDYNLDDDQDDDGSITVYELQMIRPEGQPTEPAEEGVQGVQRLRFIAGIPRNLNRVSIAYMREKFGEIRLPQALPPTRPQ